VSNLIDRYVAATIRSVPVKSRSDLERELRASIADTLDARLATGQNEADAEIAVLTELGDPSRLAAEYAGPGQYLIGPSMYHSYIRTLRLVMAFCVPPSWLLLFGLWAAGGDLPGAILTASLGAVFVALLAAFMTTTAYVLVDRSPESRREIAEAFGGKTGPWTPDRLPASTSVRPLGVNDAIEAIVGGTIAVALIFIQRSVSPFADPQGHAIPFLNPDLWSFWMPLVIAVAVAWILAEFAMLARGGWTPGLALVVSVVSLASAGIYIYLLAAGQLFNPTFFAKLGFESWVRAGSLLMLLLIVASVIDTGTRIARLWGAPIGKGSGNFVSPRNP